MLSPLLLPSKVGNCLLLSGIISSRAEIENDPETWFQFLDQAPAKPSTDQ
ncbi:hypothetical protein N8920_09065 [Opitutales bacterium]|nr:hypothetical protein [Opitutales bacterium]